MRWAHRGRIRGSSVFVHCEFSSTVADSLSDICWFVSWPIFALAHSPRYGFWMANCGLWCARFVDSWFIDGCVLSVGSRVCQNFIGCLMMHNAHTNHQYHHKIVALAAFPIRHTTLSVAPHSLILAFYLIQHARLCVYVCVCVCVCACVYVCVI